jgi:hypothetical protein
MFRRNKKFTGAMRVKMFQICLFLLCIAGLRFSEAIAAEYSLTAASDGHPVIMSDQINEEKGIFKSAVRWRKVDLLKRITQTDGIMKGDELVLDLFPGTSYHAVVDRVSVNVQGAVTIRGRIREYPSGYVLISTTGERSLASIHVPELGTEYKIVYDPASSAHYLLEINPLITDKLEDSPVVIPPPPKPEEQREIEMLQEQMRFDQQTAVSTIDVMVIYTPAAKQWADSSGGGISNVVAQSMEKAQLVADNSVADFAVRLVHSEEVAYTESGDSDTDLDRLQRLGDGYLDSVHTLRNTYKADVVVFFTKVEDTGGLGYLLDSTSGRPEYAFSITRVQQASWTYTTIHEIGHNMGLHHHKEQNVQPGPGLYAYSAGWRWVSTDSKPYCSVMTYEDGQYFSDGITHTRVAYFSNPGLTYIGATTGNAADGDNARNVREIKNVIAAYRSAASVLGSNSIGTRNTIKISDFSGSIPSGGLISVMAWDAYGNAISESAGVTPLVLYNHGTASISGSSLAARFTSVPMLYKFSIASPNVVVTNVKNSTDGTFKVPVVYFNGMTSFASNSIGNYNTIKISDFSGSIPSGGSIIVTAWDANGNAIPESAAVTPLVLYNHGTTMISGSSLAARFPMGYPMIYQFNIQSAQVLVTNVKNSTDGKLNIPVAYTSGVSNYVSNSIGKYNTLEISDLSGSIPSGALISVSAWDTSGNAIPESAGATPLVLHNHGTTSISGSSLAARFPTGSPMSYSFSIGSAKVLITNIKSSTDGLVEIPSIFSSGISKFATNYVSSLTTTKISDMSGILSAGGAAISVTAWDANGNAIPESGSVAPLILYNYGTNTITGSDLAGRFPSGFPVLYEFSIGSTSAIVTSLTTSADGTIKTPTVFTIGSYGGI